MAFLAVAVLAVIVQPRSAFADYTIRSPMFITAGSYYGLCASGNAVSEHRSLNYATSYARSGSNCAGYQSMPAGWILVGAYIYGGGSYCAAMPSVTSYQQGFSATTATGTNLYELCGRNTYITIDGSAFVYHPMIGPNGNWWGGWMARPTVRVGLS